MSELVATESDLQSLALRIRTAKADLVEAIRVREHAQADLEKAIQVVLAARKRWSEASQTLHDVAGGGDPPSIW